MKGKTRPGGSSTSKALNILLGQRAQGTRDLKEVEVYSQLHYESKVKPLVAEAIKKDNLEPKQKICVVREHTNNCFTNESDEVKDEVHQETVHINAARRLGGVDGSRTKEEIYRYMLVFVY